MEVLLHRCNQIVARPSKTLTGAQVGAATAAQEEDREREREGGSGHAPKLVAWTWFL